MSRRHVRSGGLGLHATDEKLETPPQQFNEGAVFVCAAMFVIFYRGAIVRSDYIVHKTISPLGNNGVEQYNDDALR
jgi:hypothetical protein